jgi:hypothetical protein
LVVSTAVTYDRPVAREAVSADCPSRDVLPAETATTSRPAGLPLLAGAPLPLLARALHAGVRVSNRAVAGAVLARSPEAVDLTAIAVKAKAKAGAGGFNSSAHRLAWELARRYSSDKVGSLAGSQYEPAARGVNLRGATLVIGDEMINWVAGGHADGVGKLVREALAGLPSATSAPVQTTAPAATPTATPAATPKTLPAPADRTAQDKEELIEDALQAVVQNETGGKPVESKMHTAAGVSASYKNATQMIAATVIGRLKQLSDADRAKLTTLTSKELNTAQNTMFVAGQVWDAIVSSKSTITTVEEAKKVLGAKLTTSRLYEDEDIKRMLLMHDLVVQMKGVRDTKLAERRGELEALSSEDLLKRATATERGKLTADKLDAAGKKKLVGAIALRELLANVASSASATTLGIGGSDVAAYWHEGLVDRFGEDRAAWQRLSITRAPTKGGTSDDLESRLRAAAEAGGGFTLSRLNMHAHLAKYLAEHPVAPDDDVAAEAARHNFGAASASRDIYVARILKFFAPIRKARSEGKPVVREADTDPARPGATPAAPALARAVAARPQSGDRRLARTPSLLRQGTQTAGAQTQQQRARSPEAVDLTAIAVKAKARAGAGGFNSSAHRLAWELVHRYSPDKGAALAGSQYEPAARGVSLRGATLVIGDEVINWVAGGHADGVGRLVREALAGLPSATPHATPAAATGSVFRQEIMNLANLLDSAGVVEKPPQFDAKGKWVPGTGGIWKRYGKRLVTWAGYDQLKANRDLMGEGFTSCGTVLSQIWSLAANEAKKKGVNVKLNPREFKMDEDKKSWVEASPGMPPDRRPQPGDAYYLQFLDSRKQSHVCTLKSITKAGADTETWVSADGGQRSGPGTPDAARECTRTYIPSKNEMRGGVASQAGEARWLYGWTNVDKRVG